MFEINLWKNNFLTAELQFLNSSNLNLAFGKYNKHRNHFLCVYVFR